MSLKEIKALSKLMRSEGILHIKTPELELMLSPTPPVKRKRNTAKQDRGADVEEKGFLWLLCSIPSRATS